MQFFQGILDFKKIKKIHITKGRLSNKKNWLKIEENFLFLQN